MSNLSSQQLEEIKRTIQDELVKERGRFITQFWYVIVGLFIASASAWFALFYQVQSLEQTVERNRKEYIDTSSMLRDDHRTALAEIKADIRLIREVIIKGQN